MTDVLHVGTDLMGTSRLEHTLHQRHIAVALHHLIVSNSGLTGFRVGREDLHPQTVLRVAPDVALYPTLVLHEVAPHQGVVTAMGGLVKELLAQ